MALELQEVGSDSSARAVSESPFNAENNGILPSTSNIQNNFPSTSYVPTEQNTDQATAEDSLSVESKRAKCDPSPFTSCVAVVKRKTRIRAKPRRKCRKVPAGYGKAIFVDPAPGYTEGDVHRILKTAKTRFTVNNMPFSVLPVRYTGSGGYCIQFVGKKGNTRINDVVEKLKRLPEISKVVLRGPVDMGEVFIRRIPSTISPEEIAAAVARVGRCSASDITVGKMRKMRKASSGQKLYICCPIDSAKIVNRSGEIKVGNYTCKIRVPKAKTAISNPNWGRRNFCRLCGSSSHFNDQCGVVLPYRMDERYFSFPSTSASYRSTRSYSGGNSYHTMVPWQQRPF